VARLHRRQGGRSGVFVGIENFQYLWGDAVTRLALFNTIFYTVVASIIKFVLGLWLALLLNKHLPFKAFIRAVVLLPFIVPTALSALAFWWIYDSQFSVISWVLLKLGIINTYIDFLGDPWNARFSTIAANIWRGVPFVAITLLAGLQTISPSYYEAASLDGATEWQQFRHVTLPLLTPIIAGRHDVLRAVHVHRLPAHLRAHARRTAERDAPHGDTLVPAGDLGREPWRGRGDRDRDGCRSCWPRSC
jgi:ABC-type sugar transport system permease subunit